MPVLDAHDIAAWALVIGGCAYALAASRGVATAAMAAVWSLTSWRNPLPWPGWASGMPGAMNSTGTESEYACAAAVTATPEFRLLRNQELAAR